MSMKQFVIVCICLVVHCAHAQSPVISAASSFIINGQYKAANHYLDSILRTDQKNVDAMMMKGNVLLNQTLSTISPDTSITDEDESIFISDISAKTVKKLTPNQVLPIEKIWRKCLSIDSSRNDIRKGLCTIYAMANMTNSLKTEIKELVTHEIDDDGEQAYRIAEYARKIKERGDFNSAIDVYRFIATCYPTLAGLRCDIANEFFYAGKMKEALIWLDSTYNFTTVDETSFLNGAFVYSELGYFDDAQNVLNTYSRLYQKKMDKFYYALRLFSEADPKCNEAMQQFIADVDSNAYYNEVQLFRRILTINDSFTMTHYRLLVDDRDVPYYYKPLIHQRAFKQFKTECDPYFLYGMYQSYIKNYSASIQFLEEVDNCNVASSQKEYWTMHYAYVLYMLGDNEKAIQYFSRMQSASSDFVKQASQYFMAKALIRTGKAQESANIKHELETSKPASKYVKLAASLK